MRKDSQIQRRLIAAAGRNFILFEDICSNILCENAVIVQHCYLLIVLCIAGNVNYTSLKRNRVLKFLSKTDSSTALYVAEEEA